MHSYFLEIGSTKSIAEWKSKGLSDEDIKPPNKTLAPTVKFTGKRMYVKFSGSCLKQDKITFNHKKAVNIYTVYDLKSNLNNLSLLYKIVCLKQLS